MNREFRQAIAVLKQVNEDFKAGRTSSVAHSTTREAAIRAAIQALARSFGIKKLQAARIDSRGDLELSLGVEAERKTFGARFSALLNKAKPSGPCGAIILLPESSHCRLNHFQAEKMVLEYMEAYS